MPWQAHGTPLTGDIVMRSIAVLAIVVLSLATACFKISDANQVMARQAVIGALNRDTGRFEIDYPRVQELCQQLDVFFPECADCFNRYHCARECPDRCPLDDACQSSNPSEPGFRCQAQKALAYATLRETADSLWAAAVSKKAERQRGFSSRESCRTVCGTAIL